MNKNRRFFKSKKVKLITTFVIFATFGIGLTIITSIYNQQKKAEKEQAVIVQQKEEEIENQKQEELVKEFEQKELEEEKKVDQVKEEASATSTLNEDTKEDGFTKEEEAIEIVRKIIISKNPKVKIDYDHIQKRDGQDYYVIRVYEDMDNHISTLGWYYVQGDTGKAFEWNLIEDTLIPIN